MSSSNFGRSRLSVAIALSLAFASLWAASGCKSRTAGGNSTPAASASGSAAATGPCAQYADKVCAKAGAESPTCSNFKEVTGMMSPAACTAGLKDIQVTLTKLAAARGDCEKLVKTLCAAVGPTTKTCNMVTTQTQSFPPARCKQMMEHIPQITEDLKKMEAANQPLSPDLQAAIATGGAAFGPENSKVKLVEFSDFECPYCSRAATVVHQIKEKYGDKVRFVFREFPLDGLLLEACLLHFRVVWDFFYRPKQKNTDIVVRDFVSAWNKPTPPPRLKDIRKWLNTMLAHLTTHRIEPSFKVGEISEADIEQIRSHTKALFTAFAKALSDEQREVLTNPLAHKFTHHETLKPHR